MIVLFCFAARIQDIECIDGAHSIGVQNVTSNCNVMTLIYFFFSLYLAKRLALERLSVAG